MGAMSSVANVIETVAHSKVYILGVAVLGSIVATPVVGIGVGLMMLWVGR